MNLASSALMVPYLLLLWVVPMQTVVLRGTQNTGSSIGNTKSNDTSSNVTREQLVDYYNRQTTGRGMSKWNHALVAYQPYFDFALARDRGTPYFRVAEIGVQSGGSLDMWKAVLGPSCHVYGLDPNPAAQQLADNRTTITVGDWGDGDMWANFWAGVTPTLDVLIDDGSHEANHMSMSLHQAFPHLNPGGFVAIEHIYGRAYTNSFYWPAANSIHNWQAQGLVESVSMLPFLLIVKKATGPFVMAPWLYADMIVDSFPALWAALEAYWAVSEPSPGKIIALQNPGWGNFLAEPTLYSIFGYFATLNDYQSSDSPAGCFESSSPNCTVTITNSNLQAYITAVDIFPTALYVHVPASTPVIKAVRRGSYWSR